MQNVNGDAVWWGYIQCVDYADGYFRGGEQMKVKLILWPKQTVKQRPVYTGTRHTLPKDLRMGKLVLFYYIVDVHREPGVYSSQNLVANAVGQFSANFRWATTLSLEKINSPGAVAASPATPLIKRRFSRQKIKWIRSKRIDKWRQCDAKPLFNAQEYRNPLSDWDSQLGECFYLVLLLFFSSEEDEKCRICECADAAAAAFLCSINILLSVSLLLKIGNRKFNDAD